MTSPLNKALAELGMGPVDPVLAQSLEGCGAEQCAAEGLRALEEYDYERAHGAFRLGALRGAGAASAVQPLVRFLFEHTGGFEEIVNVVEAAGIHGKGDRDVQRMHALALHRTDRSAPARALLESLEVGGSSTVEELIALGEILIADGSEFDAMQRLERAERMAPGDGRIRRAMDRAAEGIGTSVDKGLADAGKALEDGDLPQARQCAEALDCAGPGGDAIRAMLRDIHAAEVQAEISGLLDAAGEAEASGDWHGATRLWESLLRFGRDKEWIQARDRARHRERESGAARSLARAEKRRASGNVSGAVQDWIDAYQIDPDAAQAQRDVLGVHGEAVCLWCETGVRDPERHVDALLALGEALELGKDEEWGRVRLLAGRITGAIDSHPLWADLHTRLMEAEERTRQVESEDFWALGLKAEAAGDLAGAIRAFEQVVALDCGRAEAAAEHLESLEGERRTASKRDHWRSRMVSARIGDDAFAVRALGAEAPSDPGDDAIEAIRWAEGALEITDIRSGTGPLESANLPWKAAGESPIVASFMGADQVVVSQGTLLALVDLGQETWLAGNLPDLLVGPAGMSPVWMDVSEGIVGWAQSTGVHFSVHAEEGAFRLISGARHAGLAGDSGRSAMLGSDGQLLLLEAHQGGGEGSAVLSGCARPGDSPQLLASHDFGFGSVRPLKGSGDFVALRRHDPMRSQLPGWFQLGRLDRRGRLQERWSLDGSEHLLHGLRAAAISSATGHVLLAYWPADPFTGRGSGDGTAFAWLRPDGEIFYQAASPQFQVGRGRGWRGPGELLHRDGRDVLLWIAEAQGCTALVGVDGASMRAIGEAALPPESLGLQILLSGDGARAVCLTQGRETDDLALVPIGASALDG